MHFGLLASAALLLCSAATALAQAPTPDAAEMAAKLPALGEAGQRKLQAGNVQGALQQFQQATHWAEQLTRAYPEEPAYVQNLFYYMDRRAAAYSAAGQLQDALKLQKRAADGYRELAAAAPSEDAKKKAAIALEHLAWYQILTRDFAGALATAREANTLHPTDASVKAKLAHALLLTGKEDEAKAIYDAERATMLPDGRTFEQGVLAEFATLQKAGIKEPALATIRAWYGGRDPDAMPFWLAVLFFIGIAALVVGFVAFFFMVERKRRQRRTAVGECP